MGCPQGLLGYPPPVHWNCEMHEVPFHAGGLGAGIPAPLRKPKAQWSSSAPAGGVAVLKADTPPGQRSAELLTLLPSRKHTVHALADAQLPHAQLRMRAPCTPQPSPYVAPDVHTVLDDEPG